MGALDLSLVLSIKYDSVIITLVYLVFYVAVCCYSLGWVFKHRSVHACVPGKCVECRSTLIFVVEETFFFLVETRPLFPQWPPPRAYDILGTAADDLLHREQPVWHGYRKGALVF